ncbi:hypothetical protein [Clavibacter sp. VKM Ac-2872]|nr:hypothetical protein [Clavibacter sp. VKM Ac-2872]MBF4622807.1 hypothetical protein [Clavibacter sp. VKM Ac-2872]
MRTSRRAMRKAAAVALCLRRTARRSVPRRAAVVEPDRPADEDEVTPR